MMEQQMGKSYVFVELVESFVVHEIRGVAYLGLKAFQLEDDGE